MFTSLIRYIYGLLGSYLVGGLKGVLRHLYYSITGRQIGPEPKKPFAFITEPKHGKILYKTNKKSKHKKPTLNWFMMDMGTNGGGDINIFRYINGLHNEGIKSRVYIAYECKHNTRVELTDYISEHYGKINAEFYLPEDKILPADASVATEWRTAYLVNKIDNVKEKFYFIQDFEPYFFPHGSEYELARNTYTFGFKGITAGYWLQKKVADEFGMKTFGYTFSYDKEIYRNISSVKRIPKRIFFYARPVTTRRAFEIGMLALENLYKLDNEVQIVLAGWDTSELAVDFPHENLGILKVEDLPEIYSSCELGLVLSMTNCSLLPTELLACGCVPVINEGENNEWLVKDKKNGIVVSSEPLSIAKEIKRYIDKPKLIDSIRTSGGKMLNMTTPEAEAKKVSDFILRYL